MGKRKSKRTNKKDKNKTSSTKDHYTRNSIIFLLAFAALTGLGVLRTNHKYWKSYYQYPAQITRIYKRYRGGYGRWWYMDYQYIIDNLTYTESETLSNKSEIEGRQVGDTIIIEISSKNPRVSRYPAKNLKQ